MASSRAGSRRMRPEHAVSDAHVLVAPARASAGSGQRWRQWRRRRPRMDVATSGCRRGGIGGGSRPTSSPRSPDSAAGCDALMALLCASVLWMPTCLAVDISGPSESSHTPRPRPTSAARRTAARAAAARRQRPARRPPRAEATSQSPPRPQWPEVSRPGRPPIESEGSYECSYGRAAKGAVLVGPRRATTGSSGCI